MQCPPDFPAASMLVALAAVIGCRLGIRPKRYDDWLVIPNLWGCVVGRPSLKKSPAISPAEKRVRAIESRERQRLSAEVESFEVDHVLGQASIRAIKSKIGKSVKAGNPEEARSLALELIAVEGSSPPVPRRIITTDSTIEKLGEMLNKYPDGMLLWVDELMGWMRGLDRPDMAGVRQQYLTLWNGQGRLNIDRVGRGETVVEHPCLSVFGCATPGGIADYVAAALRGGRGDDGLIQRLQVLVWPDSPKEYQRVDRWPDSSARDQLMKVFENLADLEPDSFAERDQFDEGDGVPWLRFDADGQAVFDVWDEGIQNRLRSGEMHEAFESHLSKYASMVPSIALVIHLASGRRDAVNGASVRLAVRWAGYLESHAARLYSIAVAPDRQLALPLLKRLIAWPSDKPIRARAIAKQNWSGLGDAEVVTSVLDLLVDAGWVRALPVKPESGRPTTDYLIHPKAADFLRTHQNGAPKTGKTTGGGSYGGFAGADLEGSEEVPAPVERVSGVI
jgi:putative DNA primase/helicase